jgi:hypothetical protein
MQSQPRRSKRIEGPKIGEMIQKARVQAVNQLARGGGAD